MTRYFIDERDGRYFLHDRRLGYETAIGKFKDADIAQRIVALLNADEAARQQAEAHVRVVGQQIAAAQTMLDARTGGVMLGDDPLEEGRDIQNEGTDK